jgi:hypothetical protein
MLVAGGAGGIWLSEWRTKLTPLSNLHRCHNQGPKNANVRKVSNYIVNTCGIFMNCLAVIVLHPWPVRLMRTHAFQVARVCLPNGWG